jgi:hypothetical protein
MTVLRKTIYPHQSQLEITFWGQASLVSVLRAYRKLVNIIPFHIEVSSRESNGEKKERKKKSLLDYLRVEVTPKDTPGIIATFESAILAG